MQGVDHRVRVTKMLIRRAFTDLLRRKPIQSITVKELCQEAGINRGTFYAHYTDLYDLLRGMEEEMMEDVRAALQEMFGDSQKAPAPMGVTAGLFRCLRENADLCTVTLGPYGDKEYARRLLNIGWEYYMESYRRYFTQATSRELEYYYVYASAGVVGLLEKWMAEGMALTPEEWEDMTELSLDGYYTANPDSGFLGVEGTVDLLAGYQEASGIRGDALVYENEARGLTLTLPGSWKNHGACQEGEDGVLFYCAALGPETGGIAQVRFLDEPLEAVTGRVTLLGYRPGCYVYSYGLQAPLPDLQQASQEVRSRYNALYEDFRNRLILSFSDGLPVLPSGE